jgi:hypothetical protein
MLQAVQIETQSEQQSLAHLHSQRAARCTSRELALDRRKQALDQSATPIKPSWKCPAHLGAHSAEAPRFLSTLRGDHAPRPELLPDLGMIPVEGRSSVVEQRPFKPNRALCTPLHQNAASCKMPQSISYASITNLRYTAQKSAILKIE